MTQNIKLNDKAMEQAVGGINEFPEYDMMGFVVDKHPTENSAYNVKGDNDEIYICYYDGSDFVAPGTEVYMFHNAIDNTWQMKPALDLK